MGKKKKFDEAKSQRAWLRKFMADPETMGALQQVSAINRKIAELTEQLYELVKVVDQTDLVFTESLKWPTSGKALPLESYTINDEHWWQYGDNSHEYDAKRLAKNLARYAAFMERDGVGG